MTNETRRSNFLKQIVSSVTVISAASFTPIPANAAKYGGFGSDSPEVISPKDAIIDDEILKSDSVQKALASVKGYLATLKDIEASLSKDSQVDIGPVIRKSFEISAMRDDLNTLNTAFDEDTQRGTDRLIRAIVQDVNEVEIANKQKPGVPRSEIRLGNLKNKVGKLSKAFEEYLAFV